MIKKQIVFATHNLNKLAEVKAMVGKHIQILGLNDIGCVEEIIENGKSLNENAQIKADYVYNIYGKSCFADDTGLEVEALNGDPGVYSARYAGEDKSSEANMKKLIYNLTNQNNRNAQFRTVICFRNEHETLFFEGICKGEILLKKQGNKGFGYDPIFKPLTSKLSFAEMPANLKNKISHRGLAFEKFYKFLMSV